MKKFRAAWIHLAALAALLAGCAGQQVPLTPIMPASRSAQPLADVLTDVNWHLISYGPSAAPNALIPGTDSTLLLDGSTLQASGLAGCNRFTGNYAVSGKKFNLGKLGMTKRLCTDPEGLAAQEAAVTAALVAANRFSFENGNLLLHYGKDEALRYSKSAPTQKDAPNLTQLRLHLGQYPRDTNLWGNPLLAQRLHTLLGARHQTFLVNMRVQGPLTEESGLLFVTGSKPREGGADMAVFMADPANDKIQVWLSTGGTVETFSEADPPLADPPLVAAFKTSMAPKP